MLYRYRRFNIVFFQETNVNSQSTAEYPSVLKPLYIAYNWVNKPGYLQGAFWAIMVCLVSSLNDVFIRLSGDRLPPLQVSFFRFFFSIITIVPVMLYYGSHTFMTKRIGYHSLRAILGYGAVACWVAGVAVTPLAIASILSQTVGLFVLILAFVLLREKICIQRTIATVAGIVGILLTIQKPFGGGLGFAFSFDQLNIGCFYLLSAAIMFAASDILNKIMVAKEHPLTMLFYFALGTAIIGIVPAYLVWLPPTMSELFYLLCLGAGANLILFCLLKAFSATEISALQPYRYVELLFAVGFGYILFGEVPNFMTFIGAAVIIPSTLYIAIYETRKR